MTKLVGACQLLALRDYSSAQEVLCLMLEWSLLEQHSADDSQQSVEERNPLPLQVATTLQSTESGRKRYFELCDKQLHLKELVRCLRDPFKLCINGRSLRWERPLYAFLIRYAKGIFCFPTKTRDQFFFFLMQ